MSDGPYGRHGFSSNTGYGGQVGGASYGSQPGGGGYAAPSYGQNYGAGASYGGAGGQDYGSQYGSYGGSTPDNYAVRQESMLLLQSRGSPCASHGHTSQPRQVLNPQIFVIQ